MSSFNLCGELPSGTTVLEASAGTGKTYAIVGLATRFVAEGRIDVSQLLLVTFSRAATQELRERTRDRFTAIARGLLDIEAARTCGDDLLRHLADAAPEVVAERRFRLVQALSDFDSATIVTTHSFCQRMLDGLGFAGEREPDATLVEAVDDLVNEVVDDLYMQRYAGIAEPPISISAARKAARAAARDRQAILSPDPSGESTAAHLARFAEDVRAEVQRRKRAIGLRDFDDLLVLLRDVLADPAHGRAARHRISARYRVVLVDEFQDTDPLQWGILRMAFHGASALILVGDPKQAIYGFRGAEVLSYLEAVKVADAHEELAVNWRSDADLLAALEHVYGGAALGHPEIVVHPVAATHQESRLTGCAPLRLRYLSRQGCGPLGKAGFAAVDRVRNLLAADLAADIANFLSSAPKLNLNGQRRVVGPGDIAVLVRTRNQISLVRAALDKVGIPSVLAGGTSVFDTASAQHWQAVVQALEQPHRADRVRIAALTPLLGWTATELANGGDDAVGAIGAQLREWAALFSRSGFAALFERLSNETQLAERLLAVDDGERVLTDLRHIAQLLNRAAVEESFGLTALGRWLNERIDDPNSSGLADRSRRLDSDAAVVQIATVHSSKGLEFPIVYVPFGWDASKSSTPDSLLFHDENGARVLDVGGPGAAGYNERKKRHDWEDAGDELRLLYVALTRAMCQVVLWWAPSFNTKLSPLHRLIFGRPPGSPGIPGSTDVRPDPEVAAALAEWATGAPHLMSLEAVGPEPRAAAHWSPETHGPTLLRAAEFDRVLDYAWRRTSYSALTAAAHDAAGVRSEAEQEGVVDEPAGVIASVPAIAVATDIPSPMNPLPAGAAFGTLVHEILEQVDTSTPDLDAEIAVQCNQAVRRRLADLDVDVLADALGAVLRTPLGQAVSLADITPANRLAELEFELPLGGTATVTLHQVADLLRRHLSAGDVLAAYSDVLTTVSDAPLRGFLTGSIDAVLRIPGERFVVVDYKTNRLGAGDLTVGQYSQQAMRAEMMRCHYPLQALLYSVALHRYLRWRLPGYQPGRHLGGIQYLFVRGMAGPDTPPGCGVFTWHPPADLIVELSDLLAGR
ncbi:AAA family ATPase [Skermania sp. ID1734]|uniref:UvrD-helicase domain-containing protein n=1 Tax=Skermania sp. ID1734 TaxID=2597516 RepID=UPI00117F820A|nr:UvrD-helicase domain-containing protein [Skermania sp. ID1734]TSE01443.1 AAA family ATPase [Skermania sp. ID1734]